MGVIGGYRIIRFTEGKKKGGGRREGRYHFRANSSPLECGFAAVIEARQFVSFRFFLFAVVFLIFDVELILLVPYLLGVRSQLAHALVFRVVISLLSLGLLLE